MRSARAMPWPRGWPRSGPDLSVDQPFRGLRQRAILPYDAGMAQRWRNRPRPWLRPDTFGLAGPRGGRRGLARRATPSVRRREAQIMWRTGSARRRQAVRRVWQGSPVGCLLILAAIFSLAAVMLPCDLGSR